MQGAFEEHLNIITALRQNYSRDDDSKQLLDTNLQYEKIENLCSTEDADVKATIRELSQLVKQLEQESSYPKEQGAHEQLSNRIRKQTADAKENISKLNKEARFLERHLEELREQAVELDSKHGALRENVEQTEPRLRKEISLYAHISKIAWRYENQDRAAGTVSDSATGDIKPFDLDPNAHSDFQLINQLWDLLE